MIRMTVVAVVLFVAAGRAIAASEIDEAIALKNETMETFRANAGKPVVPEVYADAIRKLMRAEDLLEKAALTDPQRAGPLQQEVASQRFWAQRFANVNVADALRNGKPMSPSEKKADPPPTPPTPPTAPTPPKVVEKPPPSKPPAPDVARSKMPPAKEQALRIAETVDHSAAALLREGKDTEAAEKLLRVLMAPATKDISKIAALGSYFYSAGSFNAATGFYKVMVQDLEKRVGPNDGLLALDLTRLATIYISVGQFAQGVELYERVVAIDQKFYGPEHLEVAKAMNSVGSTYIRLFKFELAQTWLQRALDVYEKVLPPKSPILAECYNEFGTLNYDQRKLPQAEALYRKSIALIEGGQSSRLRLSVCLGNLATVLTNEGKYEEAEATYRRALQLSDSAGDSGSTTKGANHGCSLQRQSEDVSAPVFRLDRKARVAYGSKRHVQTRRRKTVRAHNLRAIGDQARHPAAAAHQQQETIQRSARGISGVG